jgi:hypothetical protein
MDHLQATVWLPEEVVQSGCPTDTNSSTTKIHTKNGVKNDVSQDISICMDRLMHCVSIHLVDIGEIYVRTGRLKRQDRGRRA